MLPFPPIQIATLLMVRTPVSYIQFASGRICGDHLYLLTSNMSACESVNPNNRRRHCSIECGLQPNCSCQYDVDSHLSRIWSTSCRLVLRHTSISGVSRPVQVSQINPGCIGLVAKAMEDKHTYTHTDHD